MRPRQEIEKEYSNYELHIREVLLDIRDLLVKAEKKNSVKRPRKKKQGGKNGCTD